MVFILPAHELKPDPASENIILQAAADDIFSLTKIRKDPDSLTDGDLAQITTISITKKELSDIKLFKEFTNLKWFHLEDVHYPSNKIPKWMSILAKLVFFNLEERFAIDLSPLANLKKLRCVNLYGTNVSDEQVAEIKKALPNAAIDVRILY